MLVALVTRPAPKGKSAVSYVLDAPVPSELVSSSQIRLITTWKKTLVQELLLLPVYLCRIVISFRAALSALRA